MLSKKRVILTSFITLLFIVIAPIQFVYRGGDWLNLPPTILCSLPSAFAGMASASLWILAARQPGNLMANASAAFFSGSAVVFGTGNAFAAADVDVAIPGIRSFLPYLTYIAGVGTIVFATMAAIENLNEQDRISD